MLPSCKAAVMKSEAGLAVRVGRRRQGRLWSERWLCDVPFMLYKTKPNQTSQYVNMYLYIEIHGKVCGPAEPSVTVVRRMGLGGGGGCA